MTGPYPYYCPGCAPWSIWEHRCQHDNGDRSCECRACGNPTDEKIKAYIEEVDIGDPPNTSKEETFEEAFSAPFSTEKVGETWIPETGLQWNMSKKHDPILEQIWICKETGRTEWRPVRMIWPTEEHR